MIYLRRYVTEPDGSQTVDIAVVERPSHAARYEALGFTRCTAAEFRTAWRQRDEESLARLRTATGLKERALGE